jgi:hypothetical protein
VDLWQMPSNERDHVLSYSPHPEAETFENTGQCVRKLGNPHSGAHRRYRRSSRDSLYGLARAALRDRARLRYRIRSGLSAARQDLLCSEPMSLRDLQRIAKRGGYCKRAIQGKLSPERSLRRLDISV